MANKKNEAAVEDHGFDLVDEIPATTRAVGARGDNPIRDKMEKMLTAPERTDGKKYSFFEPVSVDANITDAGEREKAAKDAARRLANKIGGIAKSINKARAKAGQDERKFDQRQRSETVDGRGDTPVLGVRVYLVPVAASTGTEGDVTGEAA